MPLAGLEPAIQENDRQQPLTLDRSASETE